MMRVDITFGFAKLFLFDMARLIVVGCGGPIMGDLWALKGLIEEVSAQWKWLPVGNEAPVARAYHSLTSIWWSVPEDDPIAKRWTSSSSNDVPQDKDASRGSYDVASRMKESQQERSAVLE